MSARFQIPPLNEIEYVQEDDPCVIRPFSAATIPPLKDEIPHRHNFHTIMWTWTGSSTHLVDSQLITTMPNSMNLIARGQVHLFVAASSDFTGNFARFDDDFLPEENFPLVRNYRQTIFNGTLGSQLITISPEEVAAYQRLIAVMSEEFFQPDRPSQSDALRAILCLLLIRVERTLQEAQPYLPPADEDVVLYQDFIGLVEDNFSSEHQVSFYARTLYLTAGQLTTICKRVVGKTAKQVISDRVMVEAKRKLQFTNMTIKEIAFNLGFVSPFYFTQAFTRRTQMSPSEYRAQFRQVNR